MARHACNLVANRPWLEQVGYHADAEADADASRAHDYAFCRDPRSDARDHHHIPDG